MARFLENRKANVRIEQMYVVDLWEDGKLIETRQLPGKSKNYADDVEENWLTGVIKPVGGEGGQDQTV